MWGSALIMTGIAVRGFAPVTLVTIRLTLAAALVAGLVLVRGRRFPVSPRFRLFGVAISLAGVACRSAGSASVSSGSTAASPAS
jgi:hypothetical protein